MQEIIVKNGFSLRMVLNYPVSTKVQKNGLITKMIVKLFLIGFIIGFGGMKKKAGIMGFLIWYRDGIMNPLGPIVF